jgi:hypothetical protein
MVHINMENQFLSVFFDGPVSKEEDPTLET